MLKSTWAQKVSGNVRTPQEVTRQNGGHRYFRTVRIFPDAGSVHDCMDRIRNLLTHVRSQLWLVPSVIMLAAAGLAWWLLTHREMITPGEQASYWWLYSGEAATARDLLASLLGGLMTMTSLIVSITFVILTLAANQLGPRLIAIFMRDPQIQFVLGLFIGTILYIVLIMRTLDDTLGSDGVPHLAITVATLLTILCLMALLFYLHKVASLIIADNVVHAVAQELSRTFRDILPSHQEDDDGDASPMQLDQIGPAWPLSLDQSGYLQVVDYDALVSLARAQGIVISIAERAGHYLLQGGEHVTVHSPARQSKEVESDIRAAFTIGAGRTPAQDPEHGIRQLVEIATRALSPGINDPFTAIAVIDRLGTSLEVAFARGQQRRIYRDKHGTVRVVADRSDDAGLLDAAFHPIRQAGGGHPAILIHLADMIRKLAPAARTVLHCKALNDQLERLSQTAAIGAFAPQDRADIVARIEKARGDVASAAVVGQPRRNYPL